MATHDCALAQAHLSFLKASIREFGTERWELSQAGAAGSDRRFVRVRCATPPHHSYVLVIWNSADADWERFIAIEREVRPLLDVLPVIYTYNENLGTILEEDLGERTLHAEVRSVEIPGAEIIDKYRLVIDALVAWQEMSPAAVPAIAARALDEEMFLWESEYFARHCVCGFFGRENALDAAWDTERRAIARATALLPRVCAHRDFQSENILLQGRRIRFVDFQGARLGPAGYDVASLLCDPYVGCLDDAMVHALLNHYRIRSHQELSEDAFALCAAQRLMQALGAYGNLSIHKGKQWYRAFIPVALKRLAGIIEGRGEFQSLQRIVWACMDRDNH